MDRSHRENKNLLFRYELLKARLEIRSFYLENTVKEIYENIGQVLSLVRMQLALADKQTKEEADKIIASSGQLVGQSIQDLRVLSKSFYPDADILNNQDFIEGIEDILVILFSDKKVVVNVKGKIQVIQPELRLLSINILREIIILVQKSPGEIARLEIAYQSESVEITVAYKGLSIDIDNKTPAELTLFEKITLINSDVKLTTNSPGITEIQLIIPIKLAYK